MPHGHLTIGNHTRLNDIINTFGGDDRLGGKHLRMDDGGIHLHQSGKPSGIGKEALERRQEKHALAFGAVQDIVDRQLRQIGGGAIKSEDLLKNVLGERNFGDKLISVDDLGRIQQELDRINEEHAPRNESIDRIIDSIAGHLEGSGVDVDELRQQLRNAPTPGIGPRALQKFAKDEGAWEAHPSRDMDKLGEDIKNLGPWQALARHGLIPDSVIHTGSTYELITTREREGFPYQTLGNPPRTLVGREGNVQSGGGFFHYESHDLENFDSTGDKLHISVAPEEVESAWNTIAPILLDNPDVIKHFKVTDMGGAKNEMAKLEEEIRSLEEKKNGEGISQKESNEIDQAITLNREKLDEARRVTEGAQITIYNYQPKEGDGIPPGKFHQIVAQITEALQGHQFQPGKWPEDSDLRINAFVSYRNDQKDDGSGLRPEDPDYEIYREKMESKPFYLDVVNPGIAEIVDELRDLGRQTGLGEEVRRRRNEDGGITLYSSGRKPSLFSRSQVEERRGLAREEMGRLLTQLENKLGPDGANPAAREIVKELRARLDEGPLTGWKLSQSVAHLTHALHQDHRTEVQFRLEETQRRDEEAGRLTRERSNEVREQVGRNFHTDESPLSEINRFNEEIRDFDRSTLRHVFPNEKGVELDQSPDNPIWQATRNDGQTTVAPLERQQVVDDIVEPTFDTVISQELLETVAFMEIAVDLRNALRAGDSQRYQELVIQLGDLLGEALSGLDRTTQLRLTVGEGRDVIDNLFALINDGELSDNRQETLQGLVGKAYDRALARLSDHIVDEKHVVLEGKNYTLVKELGGGSYGRVDLYQTTNQDGSTSTIVLKTPLPDENRTSQERLEGSREEVRAHCAAQVDTDSENGLSSKVIGFRSAFRGPDGLVRIALDHAPGGDLRDLIRAVEQAEKNGDIGPEAARLVRTLMFRDIIEGMRHVQESRGMIHLDLKPENFFIGGDGVSKVGDFGTSTIGELRHVERLPVDNPIYMAPEVIIRNEQRIKLDELGGDGSFDIDGHSDTWALGITAYEIFLGHRPFENKFMTRLMKEISEFGLDGESRVRPLGTNENDESVGTGVTALDRLLNQLLNPNPTERPGLGQILAGSLFDELKIVNPEGGFGLHLRGNEENLTLGLEDVPPDIRQELEKAWGLTDEIKELVKRQSTLQPDGNGRVDNLLLTHTVRELIKALSTGKMETAKTLSGKIGMR